MHHLSRSARIGPSSAKPAKPETPALFLRPWGLGIEVDRGAFCRIQGVSTARGCVRLSPPSSNPSCSGQKRRGFGCLVQLAEEKLRSGYPAQSST